MPSNERRDTRDLTKGPIGKQLVWFALPLFGSSLVQLLYNTVDLLFVGNILGKEAAAAVGTSSLLITCLLGLFIGISVGIGIVVSHLFGEKDEMRLSHSVQTAIIAGFVCGILVAILGFTGSSFFLRLMNVPEEIMGIATVYLQVYFFGMVSIVVYNTGAAILRAVGNSRSPFLFQLVGGICNVVLNAVFLISFQWGVEGVAWAGFISHTVAAILVLIKLMKAEGAHRLILSELRFDAEILKDMLRIGVPIGLQTMAITLSNVLVQYQINGLGVDVIAAFTAYFKIELLIYFPIIAFGQALTSFSAQNIGAGNRERMHKGIRICMMIATLLTFGLSTALLFGGHAAFGLFSQDTSVIENGLRIIRITFPFYFIYVIFELLGSTIRGSGKSTVPMLIVLLNICVFRTILLFSLMAFEQNVTSIAVVYPISWATTSICMSLYYFKGNWLQRRASEGTRKTRLPNRLDNPY